MATAAVLPGVDEPLVVHDDVEVTPPRTGEVRVQVGASGVCHSDLSVANGTIPLPTPIVLGHEGAGIVTEVGPEVSRLQAGDHVILSVVPNCGQCYFCMRDQGYMCDRSLTSGTGGLIDGTPRLSRGGNPLFQMAMCGTFSDETVVPEISAVKIDDDIPLPIAALIGCGVLTGVGAAMNTASIRLGDSVVVIGCGGVGLNVIQGSVLAGAERIIAVDVFESKLKMAESFGATDLVKADEGDVVSKVFSLTAERGADVAFEVIGLSATIEQAIACTRAAGEVVLVGVPRIDVMLNINASFTFLYTAKTIKGCWYGSCNFRRDVPKLLGLYNEGRLKLDELISREIGVGDINEAFEAMQSGEVARSVIHHKP